MRPCVATTNMGATQTPPSIQLDTWPRSLSTPWPFQRLYSRDQNQSCKSVSNRLQFVMLQRSNFRPMTMWPCCQALNIHIIDTWTVVGTTLQPYNKTFILFNFLPNLWRLPLRVFFLPWPLSGRRARNTLTVETCLFLKYPGLVNSQDSSMVHVHGEQKRRGLRAQWWPVWVFHFIPSQLWIQHSDSVMATPRY